MNKSQKIQLTTTIAEGLSQATMEVQTKMLKQCNNADSDYAHRIKDIMKDL